MINILFGDGIDPQGLLIVLVVFVVIVVYGYLRLDRIKRGGK